MNIKRQPDYGFEDFIRFTRTHKSFRQSVGMTFRLITWSVKGADYVIGKIADPFFNKVDKKVSTLLKLE
jgi:hypothetical protein